MSFSRRTTLQVAFLVMGLVTWGYGQAIDDARIRLIGIAFFAVATLLRFFRSSDTRPQPDEAEDEGMSS